MTITRVDFIGMVVAAAAPQVRSRHDYKPHEWPGWTCTLQGRDVVFLGPAQQRIEVPRAHCVVYGTEEPNGKETKK